MFGGATGVRTSRESPGRVRNIRNFRKHLIRVCMYEELMPGYRHYQKENIRETTTALGSTVTELRLYGCHFSSYEEMISLINSFCQRAKYGHKNSFIFIKSHHSFTSFSLSYAFTIDSYDSSLCFPFHSRLQNRKSDHIGVWKAGPLLVQTSQERVLTGGKGALIQGIH